VRSGGGRTIAAAFAKICQARESVGRRLAERLRLGSDDALDLASVPYLGELRGEPGAERIQAGGQDRERLVHDQARVLDAHEPAGALPDLELDTFGLRSLEPRVLNRDDAEILARAGTELASAAASVITRLGLRGDAFPTILAGGMFRGIPWLTRDVHARLSEVAPRSTVRLLDVEPAVGAVRMALAAARGEVDVPAYV